MPRVDVIVESPVSRSVRARQLEGMFDVPPSEKCRLEWQMDAPIEERAWNVGLIVGPSGAGKSTIARRMFGETVDAVHEWKGAAVVDDFAARFSMQDVAEVCQAVGFNTIPAWLRPHGVLSNGEKFRVGLARTLLESDGLAVVDEFTSMVDRQVAQIGAHAVQKHIRRKGRQFVAVTCHYDVTDWLQPDWILEPHTRSFRWRAVQRRPELRGEVSPVSFSAWRMFAPFHYLTADLHRAARCFCLFVEGQPAAFAGMLHRTHATAHDIMGCSRLVTLPDYQGLGLAPRLIDAVASIYKAVGKRVHTYPAHPALVRTFDKSPTWALVKKPGRYSTLTGKTLTGKMGGRPCAVFEYAGPAIAQRDAERVLSWWK